MHLFYHPHWEVGGHQTMADGKEVARVTKPNGLLQTMFRLISPHLFFLIVKGWYDSLRHIP